MKKAIALLLCIATMPVSVFAQGETVQNTETFVDYGNVVTMSKTNKEFTNPIADQLLADSAKLDTSVFEGAPGYILQDQFNNVSTVEHFDLPSGWNVDRRGGTISGGENKKAQIIDSSTTSSFSMSRDLLPHKTGKITFETSFMMEGIARTGYSYTLFGEGMTIFKIATEGDKLAVLEPGGKTKQVSTYRPNEIIRVKAILDVDAKSYELIINGIYIGKFSFVEAAPQIDKILISTSDEEKMVVWIRYVHMYFNYAVNETFMTTPEGAVPYDWERVGGGNLATVVYDNNQVYPDEFSYYFADPTTIDSLKLTKKFDDQTGKVVFLSRFLVEDKGDATISVGNGTQKAISVKLNPEDIVTGNGTLIRADYRTKFWYTLKIVADTDTKKADIYLNYQKILSDVPFEENVNSVNTITFDSETRKSISMRIDDIQVYRDVTQADYVPAPTPVKPDGNLEVGMQMYSMWHNNHFGWDWVTAYPERTPYLGQYGEGYPEVADWVTKWQLEHGFTFRTEIFSRATANNNRPIKLPTRYNAMYDGYFNSKYKEDIKFAVLYSGISTSTLYNVDDFKNNIVPHFIENFFLQPNYLIKDNKPVMFMYGANNFVNICGGLESANQAVKYLEEECKKVGFDGILLIPDGTSGGFFGMAPDFAQGYIYSYGWKEEARNSKAQLVMNDTYFGSGAKAVANVSMGWGRNPWDEDNKGELIATPQTIKETVVGIKERFAKMEDPTNMIMFTCWDEYGEGHFFAPTRVHGFEYLNAVRETVTSLGAKPTEELPTARALARMDSLDLGSRRALKMLVENPVPEYYDEEIDYSKMQLLAEWDFSKMTDLGGWKAFQQVANVRLEGGAIRGEATGGDPGICIEGLNIKASDVHVLKIETQTEGAGKGIFFYKTDVDPEMGTNGKRFEFQQDTQDWKEYDALPFTRKKLQGNITAIRWDPKDNGYPISTKFAVRKIQLWGYPTEEYVTPPEPIGLKFNGSILPNTQPPFTKDGVTYFAIHRALYGMGQFKTKYDHTAGTYTIEYDKGSVAVITVGSNIMKVNGVDVDLGAPCYYEKGNLFVPLRTTLEALGATVQWIEEENAISIKRVDLSDPYPYQEERDKSKPFSWMFETHGTEDWTGYTNIGVIKATQGALWVGLAGNDPAIKSGTFELPADEYKYLRLRIKNEAPASELFFMFIRKDSTTWGGVQKYIINISGQDAEYKEYIIDLTKNSEWKGTITQFRVDPVNPPGTQTVAADFYFDSIEFLKERP